MLGVHHMFSFEAYLDLEQDGRFKHEFLDGRVWAMAGGSPEHAAISMNLGAWLVSQLRTRPCRVFSSDLRVRVEETGLTTYPDVTVVCGKIDTHAEDPKGNTVTNPLLIVEVLSPSTEDYDRGEKLAHYKRIPSLRELLLVAHDEHRVEVWRRTDAGWTVHVARSGESIPLESVDAALPLDEVYRNPLT